MKKFPGFVGPHAQNLSRTFDAEASINVFREVADSGMPKSEALLRQRPGLDLFASVGNGPVTALFAQDGRCFACSGPTFYEVLPSGTTTTIGTIDVAGIPSTISSSGDQGHQLFITAGGNGYIYDTTADTFTQILDADFPDYVTQGLFFDSSFLALNGQTGAFHVSALYDGTDWNALDVGIESQFSDRVVAFTRTHDNLWLFGTRNTGPWYNAGTGGAAGFVPIPGTIIEHGTGAAFACVEVDNSPMWLGQDAQGGAVVWRANGYTPQRVSTFAVETLLSTVQGHLAYSWAMAFQDAGHTFYVLYVPGLDFSLVYDLSVEDWYLWSHWVPRIANDVPYVGTTHAYVWGKHLIGDRRSGAVYEQSLTFSSDAVVAF